jgi:hypothetical protein
MQGKDFLLPFIYLIGNFCLSIVILTMNKIHNANIIIKAIISINMPGVPEKLALKLALFFPCV